jgi:hypothetical protein
MLDFLDDTHKKTATALEQVDAKAKEVRGLNVDPQHLVLRGVPDALAVLTVMSGLHETCSIS